MEKSAEEIIVILTNAPDRATAAKMVAHLLENKQAACVNELPPVRSTYLWQGRIETAEEVPLLIKTTRRRYAAVEASIRAAHPYEVPEIIALPVVAGLPAYLGWVVGEVNEVSD